MFVLAVAIAVAQIPERIAELPTLEQLPDPLVFQDGRSVSTAAEWRARRAEILDMVLKHEYGRVPPSSDVCAEDVIENDGWKSLRLRVGPSDGFTFRVRVYYPESSDAPVPVVVRFGLDERIGALITERGYAYACFEHRELDPDTEGYDVPGPAQAAYPDYDWGALAAWAWGASRVLDYLETDSRIDTTQSVITGHSRTGKAALLAGALDERFAIVVPNGSGCGGAALFRSAPKGVETLKLITLESRFKSWFHADFGDFADAVDRLPFDQHFMRALIAPRVVLNTDALDDTWANPPGTARAWSAAQPVFEFLGVPERNLSHFRGGGHDQLPEDVAVLLDVADWHFRGQPLNVDFSFQPAD